MQTKMLGRTGLEVSVAGLGCGGHSRLGMTAGKDEAHAARIVSHALELGINFIDTARAYRTESAVGKAIAGRRDQVIVSTKVSAGRGDILLTAEELTASLEKSLTRLDTDYVDVFHLHGVRLEQRRPLIDIAWSLNMTVPGVVAHQSALKDGQLLKVPQFRWPV